MKKTPKAKDVKKKALPKGRKMNPSPYYTMQKNDGSLPLLTSNASAYIGWNGKYY